MRPTLTLLATLPVLGCNLFRSAVIGQTCEDLPGKCGSVDTSDPDDTYDTAPWVPEIPWTRGIVQNSIQDDELWLRATAPDGELLLEAHMPSDDALRPGPVEYDPVGNRIFLWDNGAGMLWIVASDGDLVSIPGSSDGSEVIGEIYDSQMFEGALYLVSDAAIWRWQTGSPELERLATSTSFHLLRAIFPAFVDNLFVLDLGSDGAPDLFRVTASTADSRLSFEDFDDVEGRATRGFLGPSSKPHVCSDVGAVYSVEILQGGDAAPLAFPNQAELAEAFDGVELARETSDCAWDEGAERFLMHVRTLGVLAVDTWGHLDVLATPAQGEQFLRGGFFTPVSTE